MATDYHSRDAAGNDSSGGRVECRETVNQSSDEHSNADSDDLRVVSESPPTNDTDLSMDMISGSTIVLSRFASVYLLRTEFQAFRSLRSP